MRNKILLVFVMFGLFIGLKGNSLIGLSPNLIISAGEDTLKAKAEKVVKEAEEIFKETRTEPKERTRRLTEFKGKVLKALTLPFRKVLTAVTLVEMESVCSAMPDSDLESAGFGTFPQAYILLEVLGKDNVDAGQLISALKNKRNDWKFRWLVAEMLGRDLRIKEAKEAMIEIILNNKDNKDLRIECIFCLQPIIGNGTYKGKPLGTYIKKMVNIERELRGDAGVTLGTLELMGKKGNVDALKALANIKSPSALEALKRLSVDTTTTESVRNRAKALLKEARNEK